MKVTQKEIRLSIEYGQVKRIEEFGSFEELNGVYNKDSKFDPEKARLWKNRTLIVSSFGTYGCNGKIWRVGDQLYGVASRNDYIFL